MPKKLKTEEVQDSTAGTDIQADTPPCRTVPLVPAFSICLLENRFCPYAMSFGHQYLCRHPEHATFAVPASQRKK